MNNQHFDPPLWLRNPHVQNIISSTALRRTLLRRRHKKLLDESTVCELRVNGDVHLRGLQTCQQGGQQRPMLILFHGWEGSCESGYLLSMAGEAYRQGCNIFRLNFRDHGDTHHLNRGIFNSSLIDEVVAAVAEIQTKFEASAYYLAGYSLGGNFALRVAMRETELTSPLSRVGVVCPVLIPEHSSRAIENSFGIYDRYFTKKWKRSLNKKLQHFPEYNYGESLKKLRRLRDMNEHLIPRYTEFDSVSQYFRAYTINAEHIRKISTDTLIVASADDPIIPVEDIAQLKRELGPDLGHIHFAIQNQGAHCAYLTSVHGASWADRTLLNFFVNRGQGEDILPAGACR